ncbi:DUF6959 family protein [Streptomyces cyaneus]
MPSLVSAGDDRMDGVMERVEAERFTNDGNDAVSASPGRRLPGY